MKKLLLTLPLVAGASWAGTTYYSGAQTEPAYERLLDQLNSSSLITFESVNYDAGFMNSTALTAVKFLSGENGETVFLLEHTINHSPVSMVPESARFGAANIVTRLAKDQIEDEETLQMLSYFNTGEPFVMTSDIAMDGATRSEIKINSADISDDEVSVSMSEGLIKFDTTAEGNIEGNGTFPDILYLENSLPIIDQKNATIEFSMSSFGGEPDKWGALYDYSFDLKSEKFLMRDDRAQRPLIFDAKDTQLKMVQSLSSDSPFMNTMLSAKIDNSDVMPVRSVYFESGLTGFTMDEVLANKDLWAKIESPADFERILTDEKMMDVLRKTFVPNTKMTTIAKAETVDGNIDANIDLWFTGNGSADGYTGMVTVGDLARAFEGSANVVADRAALVNTPINDLLENPFALIYLNITKDMVSLNATLEKMKLSMNGQLLPLDAMAGEIMDTPLSDIAKM